MSEEQAETFDVEQGEDAQTPETAGEPQPEQPDNGWGADEGNIREDSRGVEL